MPPRSRPHGSGPHEEPEATPSRPQHHGPHRIPKNVHEAEDEVADFSDAGRSTADGGKPRTPASDPAGQRAQTDDLHTRGTGRPGGTPEGHATAVDGEDAGVRRSIERENDGAVALAHDGYQVKQNPTKDEVAQARLDTGDTGNPKSKPDYLVEGRVFDCYSPTPAKPVRGIHWEVENKVVTKQQTQRMVVNLADWQGDMTALRAQFNDWPIPGLKELKAIMPDGEIVQIPLPPGAQ